MHINCKTLGVQTNSFSFIKIPLQMNWKPLNDNNIDFHSFFDNAFNFIITMYYISIIWKYMWR